jgi:hypothetical protein
MDGSQITYGYKRTNAPCKDCKDRYIGCHGKCERYAEFKEEGERIKEKVLKSFNTIPFEAKDYKGAGGDLRKRSSRKDKY